MLRRWQYRGKTRGGRRTSISHKYSEESAPHASRERLLLESLWSRQPLSSVFSWSGSVVADQLWLMLASWWLVAGAFCVAHKRASRQAQCQRRSNMPFWRTARLQNGKHSIARGTTTLCDSLVDLSEGLKVVSVVCGTKQGRVAPSQRFWTRSLLVSCRIDCGHACTTIRWTDKWAQVEMERWLHGL